MQVFFTLQEVRLPHELCVQTLLVRAEGFFPQDKLFCIESKGDYLLFKKY